MDAFLRLSRENEPEKISVSRLCDLCGINRSSFYLHFEDVFDLMVKIDRRYAKRAGDIFTADGEWDIRERFTQFFRFVQEHRDFYNVYFDRCRGVRLLNVALTKSAEQGMAAAIRKMEYPSEKESRYHQAFFRAGLAAMLREWIAEGCLETPEEMADILGREYTPGRGERIIEKEKEK